MFEYDPDCPFISDLIPKLNVQFILNSSFSLTLLDTIQSRSENGLYDIAEYYNKYHDELVKMFMQDIVVSEIKHNKKITGRSIKQKSTHQINYLNDSSKDMNELWHNEGQESSF